jgi:hypothetical protein
MPTRQAAAPLVSVVMANRNGEPFLADAIASVLGDPPDLSSPGACLRAQFVDDGEGLPSGVMPRPPTSTPRSTTTVTATPTTRPSTSSTTPGGSSTSTSTPAGSTTSTTVKPATTTTTTTPSTTVAPTTVASTVATTTNPPTTIPPTTGG